MAWHYLRSALRNFWRCRVATLINLICLSLGLSCFVVTYLVMDYLGGSDRQFPGADRIQVVASNLEAPAAKLRFDSFPQTGPIVASMLRTEFPELTVARRTVENEEPVAIDGNATYAAVSYADPEFLDIFQFQFLAGPSGKALASAGTAVITEEAARRLFRSTEIVGRTIRLANRDDVTITGVIAELPQPTTLRFDLLVDMQVRDRARRDRGLPEATPGNFADWFWLRDTYVTYVLLPSGSTSAEFGPRLQAFAGRHVPVHDGGNTLELVMVDIGAVTRNMINGQLGAFARTSISIDALAYGLGGLILLIACLNYANLASTLALLRGREVGLRKVVGAARGAVLMQHLLEATLLAALAFLLVVAGVWLAVPGIRELGLEITPSILWQPGFVALGAALIAAVTFVGGAYPAWVMSGVRPVEVLRQSMAPGGSHRITAALILLQFAAACFLLITVLVMNGQNRVVLSPGTNLPRDPVVVLTSRLDAAQLEIDTLKERLLQSPAIQAVTSTAAVPMSFTAEPLVLSDSPDPLVAPTTASITNVGYDFLETMDMKLLAGREFGRAYGSDVSPPGWQAGKTKNVLIDAALSEQMGWSPAEAVGKSLYLRFGQDSFAMQVVGVTQTRPLHLLGLGANASVYFLAPRAPFTSIRIARNRVPEALDHIDAVWKSLSPNVPIKRQFMDGLLEFTYRPMLGLSSVFTALGGFGLLIAGLGLFAMGVHMAERRFHEIGVRKSLGATTWQILGMLLRDFSRPLIVACLLAWPLAFVASRIYLSMFATRTPLGIGPFLLGSLLLFLVAWTAVAHRAIRAARLQPAAVLRHE